MESETANPKRSVQLDPAASGLLDQVKAKTGMPKATANEKAVKFWAPLVLANKISIIDDDTDTVAGIARKEDLR
jgi:hypothetical protein